MTRMTDLLEQTTALLAEAVSLPLPTYADEDVCLTVARAEEAGRLLDAVRCSAAAEVDARSAFAAGGDGLSVRHGFTKGAHLVEHIARISAGEAARRVRLGAAARPRTGLLGDVLPPSHPRIAAAMTSGRLGTDAATAILQALTQARRGPASNDELDLAEEALVDSATNHPADFVKQEARVWREFLDPDGAQPREDEIHARRGIRLGRERNGVTPITGDLDQEFAALVRANFADALSPDARPRFLSNVDRAIGTSQRATPDGVIIEHLDDPRTREQKQHDILHGLVLAGTRSTGLEPGQLRPLTTVMATITAAELESGRGAGRLDYVDEPVSATTVQHLICDSGLRMLTCADDGTPLTEGRLKRFFTAQQRRALAVRDGGCVWPGCDAPASWTQAHHLAGWAKENGATDITNGVLLCPAHHRLLHRSQFMMCMIDGRPHLLAPPWIDPDQEMRPLGHTRLRPVSLERA